MLAGVATFLLLLIALLAVPVTLKFQMSWQQGFQGDMTLLWLFGLVRVRLPSSRERATGVKDEATAQKTGHPERAPGKTPNLFATVRQTGFRRRVIRFIKDLWHAIHKDDISLRVRVGLGDPADTGQLWAIVGPVAGILTQTQDASIEIVPEFLDAAFELDSSGNIRLIPLQIIYLIVALLLSPSVWLGIKQLRVAES